MTYQRNETPEPLAGALQAVTDDQIMEVTRAFAADGGRWPSDWIAAARAVLTLAASPEAAPAAPLLMQDENSGREGRRYNEWHASRPDARLNAREAVAATRALSEGVMLSNTELAAMVEAAGGDAWQEGATASMEGDHVFRLDPEALRKLLAAQPAPGRAGAQQAVADEEHAAKCPAIDGYPCCCADSSK